MRLPLVFVMMFATSLVYSQSVAISDDGSAPQASAMLDVKSTTKGLLIPRVALTGRQVPAPITSPASSLVVYNTATSGTGNTAVVPGYYYWTGSEWNPLGITTNGPIAGKNNLVVQNGTGQMGTKKGYGALAVSYIIALRAGNLTLAGEIKLFAGDFPPAGWAFCNGQTLQISQYPNLFSVVGVKYGGDGLTTFGLPDLRSAVAVNFGTSTSGQTWTIGEKRD